MVTLIESTVRVTIRHSDSEAIASDAATAWISLDEATGAGRPLKPAAPGDRTMAGILQRAGESPTQPTTFRSDRRQYWGAVPLQKWQNGGGAGGYTRYSGNYARYSRRLRPPGLVLTTFL
jgi:hypothetical protein